MTTTGNASQSFYRTAKGSHRHSDWSCANFRRSIQLGGVTEIPADEVSAWAPCDVCCTEGDVAAHAAQAQTEAVAQCPNTGVRRPRCIQSECRDCGKRGTVNRSTGRLRPHRPVA